MQRIAASAGKRAFLPTPAEAPARQSDRVASSRPAPSAGSFLGRGQESLPLPVSPGYRPALLRKVILRGLRAGTRTALCLFIHSRSVLLVRPVFPAVGNWDANLEETRLAIDAHAVLTKPLGPVVPSHSMKGAVNNSPVGAVCDTANWNPPRHKTP